MAKFQQEQDLLYNEQFSFVNDNKEDTTVIDFIYCLPFELLPLVFQSFLIQDLFECMNVNALWKHRIQNSPTLWQQMTIMKEEEEVLIPKLAAVGPYIKSYKIIDGSEKIHQSSMNLIASGCLRHLQALVIHEAGYYFHGDTNNLLMQSIHCLQHSLTELELTWYKRDHNTTSSMHQPPTLASILLACPSLRRLRIDMPAFRNSDNDTNTFAPLLLQTPMSPKDSGDMSNCHNNSNWKLTHLHWSIGSSSHSITNNNAIKITNPEIESILSTCPALTYLKLDPCEEPIPLLSIYKKRPSTLRFLGLNAEKQNDIFEKYWHDDEYKNDNYYNNNYSNGKLKALVIPCLDEIDWMALVHVIMEDQQMQLQELVILHDHLHILDLAQLLQMYRGEQLHLRHTGQRKQYISTVKACIEIPLLSSSFDAKSNFYYNSKSRQHQQPHQVTITSTFCRDYMSQSPWFISQLKRIGTSNSNSNNLSILTPPSMMMTTSLTFTQCFLLDSCLRHLLDEGFPYLQELYIDNCVLESTTLTDLIVGLADASKSSLNNSMNNNTNNDEEVEQVEQQPSILSSTSSHRLSPCMKHLSFGSIPGLTDQLVAHLADIPSLKQVTLSCCYSVTDQGVLDLVDKSSTELEQVVIHDCKQVSNVTTNYIQEKLSSRIHHENE